MTKPEREDIGRKRRQRLREVEELYLNYYCAKEIHDLIGKKWDVTYGTIRNDIVVVRKWHEEATEDADTKRGRDRYVASLRSLRKKALAGFRETSPRGDTRVRGRDYKLAYEIDKELARMSGVTLKSDTRTVHVDIEAARNHMNKVMELVFEVVTDREAQLAIIKKLEQAAAKGEL